MPQRLMIVSWLLFAAAGILLFVSAWTVLPAWTYALLIFGIGAPEVSAWLCAASIAVCVLARGSSRLSNAAFLMAAAAVVLASIPLGRAPFAISRFDTEMMRALGDNFLDGVPAPITRGMRARPVRSSICFAASRLVMRSSSGIRSPRRTDGR